jgi:replication factor C small subunit
VSKNFPDFRKTLNELQRYSTYGKIDAAILAQEATSFEDLISAMKEKKFADVRKWVAKNGDMDSATLFRYFYENLTTVFEGKCIPNIILILAQYQHYATHVVDQEINNIACIVEIMGVAQWK